MGFVTRACSGLTDAELAVSAWREQRPPPGRKAKLTHQQGCSYLSPFPAESYAVLRKRRWY